MKLITTKTRYGIMLSHIMHWLWCKHTSRLLNWPQLAISKQSLFSKAWRRFSTNETVLLWKYLQHSVPYMLLIQPHGCQNSINMILF